MPSIPVSGTDQITTTGAFMYLYVYYPGTYVSQGHVQPIVPAITQTHRINHRYLGTRESIKTNLDVKAALNDVWSTESLINRKIRQLKNEASTYTSSMNNSIRNIQHYRAQILWRIVN